MEIGQAGGKQQTYTVTAVAVYDPESGRVHHIHHRVAFNGRPPAAGQQTEDALAHAASAGHDVKKLATLMLKEAPAPGAYRVDPKKKVLVRLPTPERHTGKSF